MSEDPIRKYSDAISELDKATAKVLSIASIIRDIAHAINTNPYQLMVSNVDVGFPPEVAMAQGIPRLNANEWPSAQQIAEAVANLHQKYRQAESAYHALSKADKGIVNPLPDKK